MGFIGDFFNIFLITPLTNLFVLLTTLTGNAGLGVILLTVLIKLVTFPLTMKQLHGMRSMQAVQPRMQEINKRYKDPRRRQQEMMKLYREAGINPLGCFSSLLIQMPILFALYRVFLISVGEAPESLVRLSERIYSWDYLRGNLPLPDSFLWMHMGSPDPLVIPLFVALSMYVTQKMSQMPTTDEKQRAQQSMMNFMFPLMMGFISIQLPSALGLYWSLTNIIQMLMQYVYVGGGPINWRALVGLSQEPVLPKALSQRQAQTDRFNTLGHDDDEEDDDAEDGEENSKVSARAGSRRLDSASRSNGRRRRRRYGRGRR